MGSLEIYIKIFLEKLWNIIWPLFENKQEKKLLLNQAESEEIEKTFTLTSVPDGYSLKRQGKDMCDGEPMESGGPFSILDEYDDQIPTTQFGDPQSLILLDRAKIKCDRTENCKFISVWKDGSHSMYDSVNCASGKEGINTSVTLENLHQFSGGRVDDEGDSPPPPRLPTANSPESCSDFVENTLKPYSAGDKYPGFALSNKTNYCETMLNRPGIDEFCQKRICGYTSDIFEMNKFCKSECMNLNGINLNESTDVLNETLTTPDPLYTFTSPFTFTNAGKIGPYGPTIDELRTAYSSPAWTTKNRFFRVSEGVQGWTVPTDGTYEIAALGADGGDVTTTDSYSGNTETRLGGRGAYMRGEFTLTKNSVIKILVGQKGPTTQFTNAAGGGGGTFVIYSSFGSADTPLVIAGAGGAASSDTSYGGVGKDASVDTTGIAGYPFVFLGNGKVYKVSVPGVNGYASTDTNNVSYGTTGGGFYTSGVSVVPHYNNVTNAQGFLQGGNGATVKAQSGGQCVGGWGGFGGGGGGGCDGGGGGGGWSGGGSAGGSGGSYLSTENGFIAGNTHTVSGSSVPTNSSYPGAGYVIITKL